jgi:putative spermidine/putrescine transport system permease protein
MMNSGAKSSDSSLARLGLVFFVLIGVVPFGAALGYALLYSLGVVGIMNDGFTLRFWVAVIESGEFIQSFAYSAAIAGVSVLLSVGIALALTLGLHREFERPFLSFAIYLPLAVPGVVSAFFTYQLLAKAGFFARIAYQLGWIEEARDFPDLVNDQYALGIILTFITVVMPFFVLLFLNVYQHERVQALSELARSLGASARQVVWRVALPVLLRKTWTLVALYFIFLLGSYEIPLILGQESPQMLSVLIVRELKQYDLSKLSEGYALAVIYTLVVSTAAVFLFARRNPRSHEN